MNQCFSTTSFAPLSVTHLFTVWGISFLYCNTGLRWLLRHNFLKFCLKFLNHPAKKFIDRPLQGLWPWIFNNCAQSNVFWIGLKILLFHRMSKKQLYFKCENLQKTGSFKARGALNTIKTMIDQGRFCWLSKIYLRLVLLLNGVDHYVTVQFCYKPFPYIIFHYLMDS